MSEPKWTIPWEDSLVGHWLDCNSSADFLHPDAWQFYNKLLIGMKLSGEVSGEWRNDLYVRLSVTTEGINIYEYALRVKDVEVFKVADLSFGIDGKEVGSHFYE